MTPRIVCHKNSVHILNCFNVCLTAGGGGDFLLQLSRQRCILSTSNSNRIPVASHRGQANRHNFPIVCLPHTAHKTHKMTVLHQIFDEAKGRPSRQCMQGREIAWPHFYHHTTGPNIRKFEFLRKHKKGLSTKRDKVTDA